MDREKKELGKELVRIAGRKDYFEGIEYVDKLSKAVAEFLENDHGVEEVEDVFENHLGSLSVEGQSEDSGEHSSPISESMRIRTYLWTAWRVRDAEIADLAVKKLKNDFLTDKSKMTEVCLFNRDLKEVHRAVDEKRYEDLVSKNEEYFHKLSEHRKELAEELFGKESN